MIHSTGYRSRLARDLSGGMGEGGDARRAADLICHEGSSQ